MTIAVLSAIARPMLEPRLPDWIEPRWFATTEELMEIADQAEIGWFDLYKKEDMAEAAQRAVRLKWLNSIYAGLDHMPLSLLHQRGVVVTNGAGINAYIVEGIHAARLQPILDVAMARFESDQALKAQLLARDQQLAERKRIEQAKGLLMKMKDCNEEQAYTLMRRQAMSRQQKLIQVAEQIIAMHEMLG